MKILVLNCGSSSVKYKLIELDDNAQNVLAEGGVEKVGLPDSFLKFKYNGEKVTITTSMPNHNVAIRIILDNLTSAKYGCIKDFGEIDAVGHRVVHGGEKFNSSVLITDEVIAKVKECYDLAPLHNPANIVGIEAISEIMPDVPQVGVFDTAFHQTMPARAYMYALPYEVYEKYGVRRYGFHGTSHRYVARRSCEFLGLPYEQQRIITCHIGNGASVSAVKFGKCVDTSMGLTPLAGVMMGSRSGDIDPSAVTFLMEKLGKKPQEMADFLNKESGVLGITGISSDMREIENAAAEGNERAKLALKMYNYCIKKYIGAYAAAMGGVDIIVWTAGVGENQVGTRLEACSDLEFLGIKIDEEANKVRGEEAIISTPDSKVTVCVIPTDEELMIAKDTMALLQK